MGFGEEDHRVKMPFFLHHLCFHDIWVLINFIPHLLNLLTRGKANITLALNNYVLASLEEDLSYYVILFLHFQYLAFKHIYRDTFIANEGESASDWEHFVFTWFSMNVFETYLPVSMIAAYVSLSLVSSYPNFFMLL